MTHYPWAYHEVITASTNIVPLIYTHGIRFRPAVRFTSQPLWHQVIADGLVNFRIVSDSLGSTQIHPLSLRDIKSSVLGYPARSYPRLYDTIHKYLLILYWTFSRPKWPRGLRQGCTAARLPE